MTARLQLPRLATPPSLTTAALVASGCGLVSAAPFLPSALRGLLLGVFVLVGPGAAVLARTRGLPPATTLVMVPVASLAVVILATTVSVWFQLWQPVIVLLVLAVGTAGASLAVRALDRAGEGAAHPDAEVPA